MDAVLSKDVTGHFADDGKTLMKPLEGMTAEQIYRAHHNRDQATGKLLPGFQPHQGEGCRCAHCQEYLLRGNRPAGAQASGGPAANAQASRGGLDQSKVDEAKRRLGL
jgi:hypothetical protein